MTKSNEENNNGSKLAKNQKLTFKEKVEPDAEFGYDKITAVLRWDDECGNGHNTFSVTGHTSRKGKWESCGCIHDDIRKHFPELAPLIKWHLMGSNSPTHYVANTLYHASDRDCWGEGKASDIEAARSSAKWPDATLEQLRDKDALLARLPSLMQRFRSDIEEWGLVW